MRDLVALICWHILFVGNEIFPLKIWPMRPLPGKRDGNQQIFNCRLSCVTFAILAARWRIFYTPIRACIEHVEKYTLALHNYLRWAVNVTYCPFGFVDSFDSSGKLNYSEDAIVMRNALIEDVNSKEGSVSLHKSYLYRTAY